MQNNILLIKGFIVRKCSIVNIMYLLACGSIPAAQRQFTVQPVNFTTHEATTNQYPEAPFQCIFSAVYYGVRPVITWEVQRVGEAIVSVPLPDLNTQRADIAASGVDSGLRFRLGADIITFQRVIFQHNHTGYFQLHFANRASDDGMMVRCVATHPEDSSQVVRSNWATLTLLGTDHHHYHTDHHHYHTDHHHYHHHYHTDHHHYHTDHNHYHTDHHD